MTDDVIPKDNNAAKGVDASAPTAAKRERLRLGYSDDNLENTGESKRKHEPQPSDQLATSTPVRSRQVKSYKYNEPDNYENLDETRAPPPVDGELRSREAHLENRSNKPSHESKVENRKEEYDVPNDFGDLDELAAPSLVDKEFEEQKPHLEDHSDDSSPDKGEVDGIEKPFQHQHRASRSVTELYTISYLVFFSILGTLARLGLQALTTYPGAPVQTGLLWANVGGSLIMGLLSEDQKLFREEWRTSGNSKDNDDDQEKGVKHKRSLSADAAHNTAKKTIPLYIGLATGFCGSFTSFSSFMRDAFYALANALPVPISHPSAAQPPSPISTSLNVPRNGGYSFMALLAILIITVGLSTSALKVGAHLALALEHYTPTIPSNLARRVLDRAFVVLAFTTWLGAIIMAIFPPDRPDGPLGHTSWAKENWRSKALFALVFAPPGCLLRFYASVHLNGRIKSFPLGTFTVNIFGSALEAMFIDLQHAPIGGHAGCQVLQGMSDGFCGCLTTVSTWVVEISALRRRHSYVYAVTSMGVALVAYVVITGSMMWTQGFKPALCTS